VHRFQRQIYRPHFVRTVALCLLALAAAAGVAAGRERPLPERRAFVEEVRKRLQDENRRLLSQYTYMERREEIDISAFGGVSVGPVKVYEVYPSLEPGNTWKRLIAVDGEPLSPEELARNDREHRRHLRERANESPRECEKRLEREEEERREEAAAIAEAFDLYEIRLVGREMLDGYPTIVATLDPKPGYEPRTDDGKWMKKVRGRAWVHEFDHELVRLEVEVLEDITVAWGLIGRVHQGARALLERTKVNGEIWLPKRTWVDASGRTLVFRSFDIEATTEWWNHREIGSSK
jgi:hypothetical protein